MFLNETSMFAPFIVTKCASAFTVRVTSAATGAKLTLDNTGISNVKRGVSIAADNASVVINSSEIVARYYGVTVGASGVELSVNGGTVQG